MKNAVAIYIMLVGVAIVGMWPVIIFSQTIQEGVTEMGFHLFSEFLLATMSIVSGLLLLKNNTIGKYLAMASLGMILYSVVNAAGFYGQKGDTAFVVLFISLMALTVAAIVLLIKYLLKE